MHRSRTRERTTSSGAAGVVALATNGILAQGDSITYGFDGVSGQWRANYPNTLANSTGINVLNKASSGDTAAAIDTNYAAEIGTYYNASTRDVLILLIGTNDLGGGATAAAVQASIQSIVTKSQATGYKVVVGTILPRSDGTWSAPKETQRLAVNTWILSTLAPTISRVVDFASIPLMANPADTTYYVDLLHPTVEGDSLMSSAAVTALGYTVVTTQQWHMNDYTTSGLAVSSNSNKSLQLSGSSVARSWTAISGKRVHAIKLNPATVTGFNAIGISTPTGTAAIAFNSGSVAYYDNGNLFYTSSQYAGMPTLVSLNTVGVVVDTTARLLWVTKDGTNFYGSTNTILTLAQVEAGTGGFNIAAMTAPFYAAAGTFSAGNGTFELQQSWPWTMPSGYSYLS